MEDLSAVPIVLPPGRTLGYTGALPVLPEAEPTTMAGMLELEGDHDAGPE